jgi:hypothetical protein
MENVLSERASGIKIPLLSHQKNHVMNNIQTVAAKPSHKAMPSEIKMPSGSKPLTVTKSSYASTTSEAAVIRQYALDTNGGRYAGL